MTIDSGASTVATQSLQAIPFSNLIGGPLGAAVDAQKLAANNTINIIHQVCFTKQQDGTSVANTVTFSYSDGSGLVRTLVVPVIAIVPIPYIAVNTISIDFKANISAASSADTSSTESVGYGGSVKAGGSFWGIRADLSANYSSKKDSTATSSSKYSVEYTMDVAVAASQTDMPAGLAKVLQMLQDGITLSAVPASFRLTADNTDVSLSTTDVLVTFTLKDSSDKPVAGAGITLPSAPNVAITDANANAGVNAGTDKILTTNAQGEVKVNINLTSAAENLLLPTGLTFEYLPPANAAQSQPPAKCTLVVKAEPPVKP